MALGDVCFDGEQSWIQSDFFQCLVDFFWPGPFHSYLLCRRPEIRMRTLLGRRNLQGNLQALQHIFPHFLKRTHFCKAQQSVRCGQWRLFWTPCVWIRIPGAFTIRWSRLCTMPKCFFPEDHHHHCKLHSVLRWNPTGQRFWQQD